MHTFTIILRCNYDTLMKTSHGTKSEKIRHWEKEEETVLGMKMASSKHNNSN